jgi:hypothetical protein
VLIGSGMRRMQDRLRTVRASAYQDGHHAQLCCTMQARRGPGAQPAGAPISMAHPAYAACVMATRPHRTESARMQGMQPPPGSQLAASVRCSGRHVQAMSSDLRGTHDDDSMPGIWSCPRRRACVDSTVGQDKGLVARFDLQNSAEWASTGRAAADHWLPRWGTLPRHLRSGPPASKTRQMSSAARNVDPTPASTESNRQRSDADMER